MTTTPSRARHRAPAHRRPMIGGMLASAAAIAAASVIAASAAGGTFALWNGQQAITSASIHTGSMGLTVNGGPTAVVDGTAWMNLLPGEVAAQQVTVKNTGNVSGVVTASTSGAFGPLLVHVKKGACGSAIGGASSTVSPTSLGVFTASEASLVCLQVTMPASVPANVQGTSQSFIITFTSTTGS